MNEAELVCHDRVWLHPFAVSHNVVNDWTGEAGYATHDFECDTALIIPSPKFRHIDLQAPGALVPDAGFRYTLEHAGPVRRRSRWDLLAALPAAFMVVHWAWSVGFGIHVVTGGRWPRWDTRTGPSDGCAAPASNDADAPR